MNKMLEEMLIASGKVDKEMNYWIEHLSGEIQKINITDKAQNSFSEYAESTREFILDTKIIDAARDSDYGIYMIVLSGIYYIIYRYSNCKDIIIGTPILIKEKIENVSNTILPLRIQIDTKKSFKEFLGDVQDVIRAANENMNFPYKQMLKLVGSQHKELFNVFVEYPEISSYGMEHTYELKFVINKNERSLGINIVYNQNLMSKELIIDMGNALQYYFKQVLSNPNMKLEDIEIMDEARIEKLVNEFNQTSVGYQKNKSINTIFEEQVKVSRDLIAIRYKQEKITYGEVDYRSNQLAHVINKQGLNKNQIIPIMVQRSPEMIIAMLAVLKVGGTYLPIDPTYPEERIRFVVEDSQANIMLIHDKFQDKVPNDVTAIIVDSEDVKNASVESLENINKPEDIVYMIYTSGSTGNPKGVAIPHMALHNFIIGMAQAIDFKKQESILASTTIAFDICELETISALCLGLQVCIVTEEQQKDTKLLNQFIHENNVKIIQMTPSMLKVHLENSDNKILDNVRILMVGGEAISEGLLQCIKKASKCKIYNMYGPTETTIWSTVSELTDKAHIDIGRPIANTKVLILNEDNKLCPIGVNGELCIGGDGLARGYYNRAELTKERFIDNPYNNGERIYKTGDLANWDRNGILRCLGRMDNQIKIHGHRIEIGEIEEQIRKVEGIKNVVIVAKAAKDGEKYLVAYLVTENPNILNVVKSQLKSKLPQYMIPTHFMILDELPMTPNKKIDRKQLPDIKQNIQKYYGNVVLSNLEKKLLEIWKKVIQIDYIDVNEDFFEIGGDSLKAIKIVNELEREGYDIQYSTLIKYSSIRKMSDYLQRTKIDNDYNNGLISQGVLENTIKEVLNISSIKVTEYSVGNKKYNVWYLNNVEDKQKIFDQLQWVRKEIPRVMWPHYIVHKEGDLTNINASNIVSEKEFVEVLGGKKQEYSVVKKKIFDQLELQETKFDEQIIKQPVEDVFELSAIQKAGIKLNGHVSGAILPINLLVDEKTLCKALANIINENELLRAVLYEEENQLGWKVLKASNEELTLPFVDLSGYAMEEQEQMIEAIIQKKYLKKYYQIGRIIYRFFIIKRNIREYILVAPVNHALFDGMSSEIIMQSLQDKIINNELTVRRKRTTYKEYIKQVNKGPQNITIKDFRQSIKLDEFANSVKMIKKVVEDRRIQEQQSLTLKIALNELKQSNNEIWEIAFIMTVLICKKIFGINKIPIQVFSYGREYQEENYFDVIGYFTDMIPVLISSEEIATNKVMEVIKEVFRMVKENNINFVKLSSEANNPIYKKLVGEFDFNGKLDKNEMIFYNFQGKKSDYEQVEKYYSMGKEYLNNYRMSGSALNIMSWYTDKYLYIDLLSSFEIDKDVLDVIEPLLINKED